MERQVAEQIAEILRAIAHPIRLSVIELLAGSEMSVSEIVEALGQRQAAVSHQLNLMKDKGILVSRRDGTKVYYRLDNPNIVKVLQCVQSHYPTNGGVSP